MRVTDFCCTEVVKADEGGLIVVDTQTGKRLPEDQERAYLAACGKEALAAERIIEPPKFRLQTSNPS